MGQVCSVATVISVKEQSEKALSDKNREGKKEAKSALCMEPYRALKLYPDGWH